MGESRLPKSECSDGGGGRARTWGPRGYYNDEDEGRPPSTHPFAEEWLKGQRSPRNVTTVLEFFFLSFFLVTRNRCVLFSPIQKKPPACVPQRRRRLGSGTKLPRRNPTIMTNVTPGSAREHANFCASVPKTTTTTLR